MITASATPVPRVPTTPAPPRLLDVLQQAAAERRHSVETLRASGDWTTPFILCRGNQQPRDLTNAEVGRFLGHRARTDTERRGRQRSLGSCLARGTLGQEQCHPNASADVLPGRQGHFA